MSRQPDTQRAPHSPASTLWSLWLKACLRYWRPTMRRTGLAWRPVPLKKG